MRYLVTGGAGFIGGHIVDALIARGDSVRILDNFSTGHRANVHPSAELHEGDLTRPTDVARACVGVDGIFHVAALPRIPLSIAEPQRTHDSNVNGTLNLLVAAKDAGVKRIVYSASSSAYGNQSVLPLVETMQAAPTNPYGLQKYIGELYMTVFASIYGMQTVSLRYFNVYGPRMATEGAYVTVMSAFLRQRAAGEPLTITGDGEQTRDFTHVRDVVVANILAMESPNVGKGEVVNIGAGENHSVNEIANAVGGPVVHIAPRPGEMRNTLADTTRAKALLGWEPRVRFVEGLGELLST
jgi:UDP-glucose 4-epimerase